MRLALLPLALLATTPLSAQPISPQLRAALADKTRPQADIDRDVARHPLELLSLAGIKSGQKVGDFMMGGGYFTRILSNAVGPKGRVYAYQAGEFIGFRPAYGDEQKAAVAGRANVTPLSMKIGEVAFPEKLDAIITVQNYHDLYLKFGGPAFAEAVTKRLYNSLKAGGTFLVVDHVANADPDFVVPDKLHRIDPVAARKAIEKAGFVFVSESKLLAAPGDPHDKNVFDPSIRGKTDQFIYLFRKPK
ncbi:class I SAM-dependent methyltransferase [Sphingobium nicotianae]|uniref:Methyltransferase n=1 Tax=Sphingobium nicotianae TaxID=2782607 RepID=A0A9X1AJ83_9SPHN|nr:methyltransferase [Sphingobium nicotianae]MBT2185834.1 methyltransferase [Sphingobium nicotianae]